MKCIKGAAILACFPPAFIALAVTLLCIAALYAGAIMLRALIKTRINNGVC